MESANAVTLPFSSEQPCAAEAAQPQVQQKPKPSYAFDARDSVQQDISTAETSLPRGEVLAGSTGMRQAASEPSPPPPPFISDEAMSKLSDLDKSLDQLVQQASHCLDGICRIQKQKRKLIADQKPCGTSQASTSLPVETRREKEESTPVEVGDNIFHKRDLPHSTIPSALRKKARQQETDPQNAARLTRAKSNALRLEFRTLGNTLQRESKESQDGNQEPPAKSLFARLGSFAKDGNQELPGKSLFARMGSNLSDGITRQISAERVAPRKQSAQVKAALAMARAAQIEISKRDVTRISWAGPDNHQYTLQSTYKKTQFALDEVPVSEDDSDAPVINMNTENVDKYARGETTLTSRGQRGWLTERLFALVIEHESKRYDHFVTAFILFAVLSPILQTTDPPIIHSVPGAVLDVVIESLFGIELLLRFILTPIKRRFFFVPFNIVDVLSVAPIVVRAACGFRLPLQDVWDPAFRTWDFWALWVLLCVVPFLRLLKTLRRFRQFQLLIDAFENLFEALPVLLFMMGVICLGFAALIMLTEPRGSISSLPLAMWLTIVTMSTVGYGDQTPSTPSGYLTVTGLVIVGIVYMAMPIGIVGYAFTNTWQNRHRILMLQTTRERMAQWGYSAHDVTVVFSLFDDTGDRQLNYAEFNTMLVEMGIGFNENETLDLYDFIDKDASGNISEVEFIRAIYPRQFWEIFATGADGKAVHLLPPVKIQKEKTSFFSSQVFRTKSTVSTRSSTESSSVSSPLAMSRPVDPSASQGPTAVSNIGSVSGGGDIS